MSLFSHLPQVARSHLRPAIKTVLIVEDEPLVAFDSEYALAHAGFAVAGTVDRCDLAVAAMDAALAADGIDLVIADIRLPGDRDGLDVAREAAARGIPVLFVTGYCPPEADRLALGWLAKPFPSRDLVRAIRAVEQLVSGRPMRGVPDGMTLFQHLEG